MALNVLITAASRRVPLVLGFRRALSATGTAGAVIATDVNPMSPAAHFCDRAFRVPLSSDPHYLETIRAICAAEHIGLVVPTIDDELALFGAAAADFATRGVLVAASPTESALLCDDKYATCAHLRAAGVPAAESFLPGHLPPNLQVPVFVKPRRGRGSLHAYQARTVRELDFFLGYVPDPIVQTYLDGPEFTIDVMCGPTGRPLAIVPRERVVIRSGVIDRGRTVRDPALQNLAMACVDAIPFFGAINIQCRMAAGQPAVFEINPRFSGGIPLTIQAGADFPRMLVQMALGREVEVSRIDDFRSDIWMSNYEASVFFPPADTASVVPIDVRQDQGVPAEGK